VRMAGRVGTVVWRLAECDGMSDFVFFGAKHLRKQEVPVWCNSTPSSFLTFCRGPL